MNEFVHFSEHMLQHLGHVQSLIDQLHPEEEPEALAVPGSPEPRASVIVFTGSFNPPTTAHIAMLKQAK